MQSDRRTQFNPIEFEYAYPEGIENHYWTISRNRILARCLRRKFSHHGTILEIGCGKGIVVAALRAQGLPCWGVELANIKPVENAVPFVQTNRDAMTLDKDFRDTVNTLMFLDVLEHVELPDRFVREILECYPHATQLVITVPARQDIWSNYDEFYRHYLRYDPLTIRNLVNQLGFDVRMCHYFFHMLYLAAKLELVFSGKRGVKIHAPRGIQKIIHRTISWGLLLDHRMLPGKLAGSSLICIATKKN